MNFLSKNILFFILTSLSFFFRETIHGFVNIVARGIFTDDGMKAIEKYHGQNAD